MRFPPLEEREIIQQYVKQLTGYRYSDAGYNPSKVIEAYKTLVDFAEELRAFYYGEETA